MISRKDFYFAVAILLIVLGVNIYFQKAKQQGIAEGELNQFRQEVNARLDDIKRDQQTVKTPQQITVTVPKYTPDVKPILVVNPNSVPVETVSIDGSIKPVPTVTPESVQPGSLVIPPEGVTPYWNSVTKCATDQQNLGRCQKELEVEKKKHGGLWRNIGQCGLKIGLGAGVGGAFGGKTGAIAGGTAGGGACFIRF